MILFGKHPSDTQLAQVVCNRCLSRFFYSLSTLNHIPKLYTVRAPVYFLPTFWRPKTFFHDISRRFFHKILPLHMVSIQEWFLSKSGYTVSRRILQWQLIAITVHRSMMVLKFLKNWYCVIEIKRSYLIFAIQGQSLITQPYLQ